LAWQPYGISSWMGWNPYIAGAWAFTPGFGYAWASAYPWGWMPYHYGSWAFQSGTGWFWVPGNTLRNGGTVTNWQPTTAVVNAPAGYQPPAPPTVAGTGHSPSILVGQIGSMPAYIPGGPVPPDFRSVIVDHSRITGMTAPVMSGAGVGGSSIAAQNSRAVNMSGANPTAVKGSTFAPPAKGTSSGAFDQEGSLRGSVRTGHVFAAPPSPSFGGGVASAYGSGASSHGTGGMSHAASSAGASHSSGAVHK